MDLNSLIPVGRNPRHLVTAAAVMLALLTVVFGAGYGCADGWKPTGDGKTIVNTRTGELRDTATGMRVADLVALNRKNAEESAAAREKDSLERQERARKSNEEHDAQLRVSYNAAANRILVHPYARPGGNPSFGTVPYWFYEHSKPFRLRRFPTNLERNEFVDFLDACQRRGGDKIGTLDEIAQLIALLRACPTQYY